MSNLNGSNVRSLMEAYNSIYEPKQQELTEEQIWEEVEAWVNALIEEGHDLSEFTWEEIYQVCVDEMLSEQGQRGSGMRTGGDNRAAQQFGGFVNFIRGLGSQGTMQGSRSRFNKRPAPTASTTTAPNPAASTSRPAPIAPNPAASTSRPPADVIVKAAKGGVPGTLNKTTGKWTPSASSSTAAPSAAPAPKPAAAAPTAPASGAMADKAPAPAKRPSILSGLDDLKRMRAASMMRQQGRNLPSGKVPVGDDLKPKS